jgi:hypothetical protein
LAKVCLFTAPWKEQVIWTTFYSSNTFIPIVRYNL